MLKWLRLRKWSCGAHNNNTKTVESCQGFLFLKKYFREKPQKQLGKTTLPQPAQ
jgi:hypothetical protein